MNKGMLVVAGVVALASSACAMFGSNQSAEQTWGAQVKEKQNQVNPIPDKAKHPGHFPEAIPLIRQAFDAQTRSISPAPAFIRGFAVVDDWQIQRNARGVILGRDADAEIFYKGGESGWCRFEHVTLHEDNQGGQNWGKPVLTTMGLNGPQPILTMGFHCDCGEINTLPRDP